ncbi:MFS transporter [Clostridium sp. MB05]
MRKEKKYLDLSKNAFVFGFVSMLNDFSSEITVRTLPLFLANVLGVKTSIIGLIEGIADTTATLLKIFSGYISDKIGKRKNLVTIGYGLSTLSKPLLYFANSWFFVLIIRFMDRVGKGIRTSPKDALISESSSKINRGKSFGFNRAADQLGAVLGLLGASLLLYLTSKGIGTMTANIYKKLVFISTIPALFSVLLIILFIKDVKKPEGKSTIMPSFRLKDFDKSFIYFLVILLIFTLGNSSDAFLILRAQSLGMSIFNIFIMLAMFNFVTSVVSFISGSLSDKIGRKKLIIIGWVIYSLIYLGFAFAKNSTHIFILYVLYGIYYGCTGGVSKAFIADIVPSSKRGTAYGLYNGAIGIMAFPASFLAGLIWQYINISATFIFGSILAIIASLMMIKLSKRDYIVQDCN